MMTVTDGGGRAVGLAPAACLLLKYRVRILDSTVCPMSSEVGVNGGCKQDAYTLTLSGAPSYRVCTAAVAVCRVWDE